MVVAGDVVVRKLKFDSTVKRAWEADLVEAAPGWVVAVTDNARHGAWKDGEPVHADPALPGIANQIAHGVLFLATGVPLAVGFWYDAKGGLLFAQADASFPAVTNGREISFVDLDLDLIVEADGNVYGRDFDDLAANGARMGYSEEAIEAAWAGLRLAGELWAGRRYPFDGSAEAVVRGVLAGRRTHA